MGLTEPDETVLGVAVAGAGASCPASVTDDLGTIYRETGSGGGGTDDFGWGINVFGPSVPVQARRLVITSPDLIEPIEVAL